MMSLGFVKGLAASDFFRPQDTSPRGLGVQEHHRIHRFDVPERSKVLGISTSWARTMPVSGLSQKS